MQKHDIFITVDRSGAPRCTGGICATARDFARIGQLLVDDGQCGLNEILPKSLIDDISNNGDPDAWAKGGLPECKESSCRMHEKLIYLPYANDNIWPSAPLRQV